MVTKRRRVWDKTCCMEQGHFMLHFTTFYHVSMYMKWAQKLVMRSSILAKFLKLNLKALRILGCVSFRRCSCTSWCMFVSYKINRYQLHKIACKCQTWCNHARINGDIHGLHAIQWFIITKLVHNKVTMSGKGAPKKQLWKITRILIVFYNQSNPSNLNSVRNNLWPIEGTTVKWCRVTNDTFTLQIWTLLVTNFKK